MYFYKNFYHETNNRKIKSKKNVVAFYSDDCNISL